MFRRLRARRLGPTGFTLLELMIVVAILSILAVVAIPSYIKYMKRSKTREAIENLEHVFRGAVTYFATPQTESTAGEVLDCQFPNPVAATPAASCCDAAADADSDGRCDVATDSTWGDPVWHALNFAMVDNHFFVYRFESTGVNDNANFGAVAHADLDCDGVQSTFKRRGLGVTSSVKAECSTRSSHALEIYSETE